MYNHKHAYKICIHIFIALSIPHLTILKYSINIHEVSLSQPITVQIRSK